MNPPTAADRRVERSPSALWAMVRARTLEFIRQPEAVFWVYIFPILMVVALGIAFRSQPIETFDVLIETGPQAGQIAEILAGSTDPVVQAEIVSSAEAEVRLRTGKTSMVIAGSSDGYIYRYDPTRPGSLAAKGVVDRLLQIAAGRVDPVRVEERPQSEPGGRYIDFLVPGLLGMGLMGGGLFGVGFAIVDMRLRKLLKLFLATPMKRSQFLMSLMISRLIFMVPEVILLLLFAWLVFGVQVYGSWPAIIVVIVLGAIQFSGVGLLIASRVKTLEAASGLMNLVMLPMWTLSGIFFAYDRFPEWLHPLIKALPLTPLIDALRAMMLEGTSLFALWPELLTIIAWSILSFAVALKIFRWNDDD